MNKKRVLRNKRRNDRKMFAIQVYIRDRRLCKYCGCLTILAQAVPMQRRIRITRQARLIFIDLDGNQKILPLATLDHLKDDPLDEHGIKDLVLACKTCNQKRATLSGKGIKKHFRRRK